MYSRPLPDQLAGLPPCPSTDCCDLVLPGHAAPAAGDLRPDPAVPDPAGAPVYPGRGRAGEASSVQRPGTFFT